jgi:hypothetical protein
MVTKTLKTLVIPTLTSAPFTYEIIGSGKTVTFDFKVPQFTSHWAVVDHTKPQILSIEACNLVSFAPEYTDVLQRVNALNEECIGKFCLVNQDRLDYCLELPYTKGTPPAAFQHALFLALDTVATNYEAWLQSMRLFDRIKAAFG